MQRRRKHTRHSCCVSCEETSGDSRNFSVPCILISFWI
ncbi:unnamed protein product [Schistosoma curassoni]|uniref:Uncharacterized protein n=1 Tax=Schistosoma curassoni TaxID=6186 RepID=A0A183KUF8_9TREM|nr:unnamed protein product [Schistosoma curassoni]